MNRRWALRLTGLAGLVLAGTGTGSGLLAAEAEAEAEAMAQMTAPVDAAGLAVAAAGDEDLLPAAAENPPSPAVDPASDPEPATTPAPAPAPEPATGHRHVAANLLEVHSRSDAIHPAARSDAIQDQLSALGGQLAAGEVAAARGHLEQLEQLLPRRSLTLLRSRAWYALVAGDDAVARSLYGELAARVPGDREATINLAIVEARLGEHDAAMQRLQRLLANNGQGWDGDGQALALLRSVNRLRESAALDQETRDLP